MKKAAIILLAVFARVFLAGSAAAPVADQVLPVAGLREPVEIVIDTWGMPHIYAQNQRDLFFAQGFNAARDRLFQLELWRRRATGTMAEIQGREALKHDVAARLLQFRTNDLRQEMNHYHPQGEEIITSFVAGVNAYIAMTEDDPSLLPLEFNLLGIRPGRWTPEVVLSRHNGLYRNVKMEVQFARLVPLIGVEQLKNLLYLRPHVPDLAVPEGLDYSLITDEVLERYRPSQKFTKEDLESTGSNNWVVSGERTITGRPVLANDPHRTQQVPSLRYWVHLVAPNWNVIGAGEPALPGVSIGHNQYGAWGLTIFAIDQEDLYVYDTKPGDAAQYRYQEGWERMRLLRETIPVRGASPESDDLKFTRHGPVLFEDTKNHKAYALRAAWLEIGTAPYLASLRIDQVKHWEEFRQACSYFRTPSENLIWADVEGNIGWQAVGLAPIRKNWSGLLPVTGDGHFEWNGYLPILELPHRLNPPEGFIATANQENLPPHYPVPVGFLWADPFRFARIQEFLNMRSQAGMMDMIELQQDVLSVPARTLVPLLKGLRSADPNSQRALELLRDWDFRLLADSVPAALYVSWERTLKKKVWKLYLSEAAERIFDERSLKKMIDLLLAPDAHFGADPIEGRDRLLIASLEEAVAGLVEKLGPDMSKWQYGQAKFHHILIRHPLSEAVTAEVRDKLNVGPAPRGGNNYTVDNTGGGDNQESGGSFRIIVDLENWDHSLGTQNPGQSGDPDSPHYRDLFELWARGKYFPVLYTREKIHSAAESVLTLKPGRRDDRVR